MMPQKIRSTDTDSEHLKTYAIDLVKREEEVRRVCERVRQHHFELVAERRVRVVVRHGRALVRGKQRGRAAAKHLECARAGAG